MKDTTTMSLTELQSLREQYAVVMNAIDPMFEVWVTLDYTAYAGHLDEVSAKRIDAINKHLEVLSDDLYSLIVLQEGLILSGQGFTPNISNKI